MLLLLGAVNKGKGVNWMMAKGAVIIESSP